MTMATSTHQPGQARAWSAVLLACATAASACGAEDDADCVLTVVDGLTILTCPDGTTTVLECPDFDVDGDGEVGAADCPSAGVCGWNSVNFLARVNQGSQPYNCNTAGNCTCNGAGWTRTTDVESVNVSPTAIGSGPMDHPFTVLAWDAATAPDSLLGASGTTYMDPSSGSTYRYVEVVVPAMIPANPPTQPQPQAREVRVQVALSNLDLWNPSPDPANIPVLESDGPGSEVLKLVGASQGTTMTAAFYEKIAQGYGCSGTCVTARVRRRYKALVEARLAVPASTLSLNARSRATAVTTATPEPIQGVDDDALARKPSDPFNWDTCENLGWSSGTCSPQVPTTAMFGNI